MRESYAIASSSSAVQPPLDARQELNTRLDTLQAADSVSVVQLNKCLVAVTQCREHCGASSEPRSLRLSEVERMVNALTHVDEVLQRQRLVNRREARQVLDQIKRGVLELLDADLQGATTQAQKQKALVAASELFRLASSERAHRAELDALHDECAWLVAATARHPHAIAIRKLDSEFDVSLQRLPEASRPQALLSWQEGNADAFSPEAAYLRFPFDGPSTHLSPALPAGRGGPTGDRYIPICSVLASRWITIGLHLKERKALHEQLQTDLNHAFTVVQTQPQIEARGSDPALMPYMLASNDLAKKQQLLARLPAANEQDRSRVG